MTAEQRAGALMGTPRRDLPPLAREYAAHLGRKFGGCGEVFYTAFAHYAQAVEGLPAEDPAYATDEVALAWFKEKR